MGFEDEPVGGARHPFASFPKWFGMGGFVDHEGPPATPSLHGARHLEFAVGASDGARGQVELLRQVANGRQPTARLEPTDGDHHGELGS